MSIWGVANPLPLPVQFAPGGDVALTAGVATLINNSGVINAPAGLNVAPLALISLIILCGAGAPTALSIILNIAGVSTITTFVVAPAFLVASSTFQVNFVAVGASARNFWIPPGNQLQLTGLSATNGCTVKAVGSSIVGGLIMGPDV